MATNFFYEEPLHPETNTILLNLRSLLESKELVDWELAFQILNSFGGTHKSLYDLMTNNKHKIVLCFDYDLTEVFENFEELDLSSWKIEKLPDSVCKLTKLRNLNIAWNNLRSLPDDFPNLKSLETLVLSYNRFEKLPASISQLNNLQKLYLHGNPLHNVIDVIKDLNKLNGIYFSDTKVDKSEIEEIKKSFPNSFIYYYS